MHGGGLCGVVKLNSGAERVHGAISCRIEGLMHHLMLWKLVASLKLGRASAYTPPGARDVSLPNAFRRTAGPPAEQSVLDCTSWPWTRCRYSTNLRLSVLH